MLDELQLLMTLSFKPLPGLCS